MNAVQDVNYWRFMIVLEQREGGGTFGGQRRGVHRQVTRVDEGCQFFS